MEGLTIEEARKLLDEKFEEEKTREIQIVANGENFTLIPEQLEDVYKRQLKKRVQVMICQ